MPIRFHCESCEARVKVPAGSEGRRVKCPRCGHLQRVPRHSDQLVTVGAGSGDPSDDSSMGHDSGSFQAEVTPAPAEKTESSRKIDLGDRFSDLAMDYEKDMTPPQMQRDESADSDEREPEVEQADKQPEQMSLLEQTEQDAAQEVEQSHQEQESEEAEEPLPQVESRGMVEPAPEQAQHQKDAKPEEPQASEQIEQTEPVIKQPSEPIVAARPAPTPAPPQPIALDGSASRAAAKVSEPTLTPAIAAAVAISSTEATAETTEATDPARATRPARHVKPYTALKNLATCLRITPAVLIPVVLWHVLQTVTVSGAIVTLISGAAIVAMTWTLAEIADAVRDLARRG